MSRIITNTNIIVDDFSFCKSFPKNTFIHFLTHFHSDHYEGLSPLWDYGPIYCSEPTKNFLLHKYPKLPNIHPCKLYKQYPLQLRNGIKIIFYFFDAKHIPGSVMILFQGYMGSIMFTGDFRYQYSMVTENQILFPKERRTNFQKREIVEQMDGISIHIDQLVFDNTYCNQFFRFGVQADILKLMIDIIQKNKEKQLIYIAMGALGKHKILVQLAKKFQTTIIVSQKQLQKITIAGLSTDHFSTDPSQGKIQLISKKNRSKIIQQTKQSPIKTNFICIDTDFLMLQHQSPDKINYIVPYSLHSNYLEMSTFIRMLRPCILRKIVIPYANFRHVKLKIRIDHRLKFSKYLDYLEGKLHRSQSGYAGLVRKYTEVYRLSEGYLRWFDPRMQEELRRKLGVGEQDHSLRKRPINLQELQDSQSTTIRPKKPSRKSLADSLNATHKNHNLQDSFSMASQSNYSQKYKEVFSQQNGDQCSQKTLYQYPYELRTREMDSDQDQFLV